LEKCDNVSREDGNIPDIEKYIFILNPTAGKHRSTELKEEIFKRFQREKRENDCLFVFTERPLHAVEIAREYAQQYGKKAILYACGGDGTVNEVVNGIAGTKAVFSVIPAGTGNDFIKSVYEERQASRIIEKIFDYNIKTIDSAILCGRTFVNVSSLGFDTMVGDRAKKIVAKAKFLGGFSYFIAIFLCLFGKNFSAMKYVFHGTDESGEERIFTSQGVYQFVLAAIANGKAYGGMFLPCPMASLTDGYLDICLIDRLSPLKILMLLPKYIKGTHISHPVVHLFRVKKGYVEGVGEELLINCDGESFQRSTVEFEIIPGSLRIAYY
jgi:YegS/Rv2252/BmrU family lipid kinase